MEQWKLARGLGVVRVRRGKMCGCELPWYSHSVFTAELYHVSEVVNYVCMSMYMHVYIKWNFS